MTRYKVQVGSGEENEAAESCCPRNVHLTVNYIIFSLCHYFNMNNRLCGLIVNFRSFIYGSQNTLRANTNIVYTGKET